MATSARITRLELDERSLCCSWAWRKNVQIKMRRTVVRIMYTSHERQADARHGGKMMDDSLGMRDRIFLHSRRHDKSNSQPSATVSDTSPPGPASSTGSTGEECLLCLGNQSAPLPMRLCESLFAPQLARLHRSCYGADVISHVRCKLVITSSTVDGPVDILLRESTVMSQFAGNADNAWVALSLSPKGARGVHRKMLNMPAR